jgi:hypothetical protein
MKKMKQTLNAQRSIPLNREQALNAESRRDSELEIGPRKLSGFGVGRFLPGLQ